MLQGAKLIARIGAAVCLLAGAAGGVFAQEDDVLTAKKRMFPAIGPGLRAVKVDSSGRYYVLASPAPGLTVFDAAGKTLLQIPSGGVPGETSKAKPPLVYGEDCDVDAEGRIYVADRGADAVKVFSPKGELIRTIPVPAPVSLAVLSDGEVAVATLRGPHLVTVFDAHGKDVREFGDPQDIVARAELNRFLNIGRLTRDAEDHLYYGFDYLPEPTVRQFDRYGYAGAEIQVTTLDVLPKAQAIRREIEKQERRGGTPSFKRMVTAVGVDPARGEVWMALENNLFHFDREGNRRAFYKLYTPGGARLEATSILIEPNRLVIGGDPLGIYEFERPSAKDGAQ